MRTRSIDMSVLIAVAALGMGATGAVADDGEVPFAEAELFFELNDTDGDLGIHGKVDGGPWKMIEISDPRERRMLRVKTRGRLRRQGLTELFFESAEPTFDELDPEDFFRRFPEGTYEIEGVREDGAELESETELTHTLPAPALTTVNAMREANECDPDEPDYDAPITGSPVTIAWEPVEVSHPELGTWPPVAVTIVNYELVAEVVVEVDGEEFNSVFSAVLPPGETSLTLPEQFLAQGSEFKYEVLAREASYNQTAVESCFLVR